MDYMKYYVPLVPLVGIFLKSPILTYLDRKSGHLSGRHNRQASILFNGMAGMIPESKYQADYTSTD